MKTSERVVVGMSGGVDSTTAAWLLRERGCEVVGVTLELSRRRSSPGGRSCLDEATLERARSFCRRFGIEHHVIGVEDRFDRSVVRRFVAAYRAGRTPNPCVSCNELVKFPALVRAADRLGCRTVATGHYARIVKGARGMPFLATAADPAKDQSYFLYRVPAGILRRLIFPLGDLSKEAVKKIASQFGYDAAISRESQDVCFVPDGDVRRFLEERIGDRPGEVMDEEGRVIGRHRGVYAFTIGQRKGLGIAGGKPLYVSEIDAARRRVVLAGRERSFFAGARCLSLRLRPGAFDGLLAAKVRYRRSFAPVREARLIGPCLEVRFAEPQWAVTPGQSLVLYRGDVVVGGGIIAEGVEAQ